MPDAEALPGGRTPDPSRAPPPKGPDLAALDRSIMNAVVVLDPQGWATGWNDGAERILGRREEEIVGRPAELIFTPRDVATGRPAEDMRLAERDGRAEGERWHVRRDGARFRASGFLIPLAPPIRQGSPRPDREAPGRAAGRRARGSRGDCAVRLEHDRRVGLRHAEGRRGLGRGLRRALRRRPGGGAGPPRPPSLLASTPGTCPGSGPRWRSASGRGRSRRSSTAWPDRARGLAGCRRAGPPGATARAARRG